MGFPIFSLVETEKYYSNCAGFEIHRDDIEIMYNSSNIFSLQRLSPLLAKTSPAQATKSRKLKVQSQENATYLNSFCLFLLPGWIQRTCCIHSHNPQTQRKRTRGSQLQRPPHAWSRHIKQSLWRPFSISSLLIH